MTGFDANSLFNTSANGGRVLGDTSSKGAWFVANTRFNAHGQLVLGPQWQGTVDPFPKTFNLNKSLIKGTPDPGGGPNLLSFGITHEQSGGYYHHLGGQHPATGSGYGYYPEVNGHHPVTGSMPGYYPSGGYSSACPSPGYPVSSLPEPVYHDYCAPPASKPTCPPIVIHCPTPAPTPVPCPVPKPAPVPTPYPVPVPKPMPTPMPYPVPVPTPVPPPLDCRPYPHRPQHGYPQSYPAHPGYPHPGDYQDAGMQRQRLLENLMSMAKRLLYGDDQGLPLNEALPSPFGRTYMTPNTSPYADVDPWSGNSVQPSGYQPGYGMGSSSSGSSDVHRNPSLDNWLNNMFTPNWTQEAKTGAIYPPITGTTDLLGRTGVFPTLNSLLERGGLQPVLTNLEKQGAFIVFAPTEKAFQRLQQTNPRVFQQLQDPRNVNILNEILKYHVSQASRQNFLFPANQVAIDSLTSRDAILYTGNAFQGSIANGNQSVTTGRALKLPNNTLVVPIDDVLIPPGLDLSKLC